MPLSPRITVLMTVYNGGCYLREAIESILNQTYVDFEFLIIDDGSTDTSASIIESYSDQRIKFLRNARNMGLSASLNRGIELARGEYIARMDADDISLPDRLEKQFVFLEHNSAIGVVGTAFQIIDSNSCKQDKCIFPLSDSHIKWSLFFYCPLVHPSVMIRKYLLEGVGGYSLDVKYSQDYDLWFRISKITSFENLPDILIYLRKHSSNISSMHAATQINTAININRQIISDFLNEQVSFEVAKKFWNRNITNVLDAIEIINIVNKLKSKFLKKLNSNDEKKFVNKYIIELIDSIFSNFTIKQLTIPLLYNPSILLFVLANKKATNLLKFLIKN